MVRSFRISAVFGRLTVLENVRIALRRERGNSFDFWRSEKAFDAFNDRAMALLEDVGLAEFAAEAAVNLPYGRKRALEIATTLALNPRMLLLDEPKRRYSRRRRLVRRWYRRRRRVTGTVAASGGSRVRPDSRRREAGFTQPTDFAIPAG